jgi:hypothetical protein
LPNGFTPIGEYASGGIFSRPTLGIIGERGPEAVVPLNRYNQQTGAGNYQISVTHTPTYNYKPTKADYERDAKEIVSALGKELQIFTKRSARDFVR